jgi:hypothetical protein
MSITAEMLTIARSRRTEADHGRTVGGTHSAGADALGEDLGPRPREQILPVAAETPRSTFQRPRRRSAPRALGHEDEGTKAPPASAAAQRKARRSIRPPGRPPVTGPTNVPIRWTPPKPERPPTPLDGTASAGNAGRGIPERRPTPPTMRKMSTARRPRQRRAEERAASSAAEQQREIGGPAIRPCRGHVRQHVPKARPPRRCRLRHGRIELEGVERHRRQHQP